MSSGMVISNIELYKIPLKSLRDVAMAGGKNYAVLHCHVVKIDTDVGLTGWGEVSLVPHFLPAYSDGVAPAIKELSAVLIGSDPVGPESLMTRCDACLPKHRYVKSLIDMALWDITAKAAGLPLFRLLGGRQMDSVPLYDFVGCKEPAQMAREAKEIFSRGLIQIQLKIGADQNLDKDVERVRAVRKAVGEGAMLLVDWNAGATPLEAIRFANATADLDIILEQPCESMEACSHVSSKTNLAIKMDEGTHDIATIIKAHEQGCLDAVSIKLSKFGGLSAARRARDLGVHYEAMMTVDDACGTEITTAALVHFALSTPRKYLLATCDLASSFLPKTSDSTLTRTNTSIAPSEAAGLGVTPYENKLGEPILCLT